MFFLWMVTLEDVCRETESSIEMRRFGGQKSEKFSIEVWVETHTKPIRAPKMRQQEHTTRDTRARDENARSRCNATAPGANTKQRATGENNLGRIGKDEVSSSNLDSSSTKSAVFCWKRRICFYNWHLFSHLNFCIPGLTT